MHDFIKIDLQHNWHPCAQMKDFETAPPLLIKRAKGAYIELQDGRILIDAISSWWCKSLGHGHPLLKAALKKQLDAFEHVMFGNTTHENIIKLSQKLAGLTANLDKVFYASDGSSSVEIALKMSLHAHQLQGQCQKTLFMGLENAYHGETALAMSVSDLGIYRQPYEAILHSYPVLKGLPYVSHRFDPLWEDCSAVWPALQSQLEDCKDHLSAVIVEPLVQGAAGMRIYAKDFLKRLRAWTSQNNVHLIADEIMTGFFRTGPFLACDHAGIEPDFICLGKGLTGGFLPLSALLTSRKIYNLFYDDYEKGKSFLHSHTHSGNALAVSVALATFEAMEQLNLSPRMAQLEHKLATLMHELAEETGRLTNVSYLGGIAAATLVNPDQKPRFGHFLGINAAKHGILLRPIGETLYWLPPLNIEDATLLEMKAKTGLALCM